MKKAIAMLLALALLCAGSALASEWQPGKPYKGVPEMDLTQVLGYMVFSPNSGLTADLVCQRLYLYLPREDVEAGEGSLRVFDGEKEVCAVPMTSEAVTLRPMTEEEKTMLQWQGGVCFEVRLTSSLPLNKSRYVNLDADCVVTLEGGIGNIPVTGTNEWLVQATGDYGVGGLTYLRDGEAVLAPAAGDTIRFDLTLGGDAAIASIYSPDASVAFDLGSYMESGEVVGQVVSDAPSWGVVFLSAEGVQVGYAALD